MNRKNTKYYFAIMIVSLFSFSISAKAMELHYYDKDIVAVLNDAIKALLLYAGELALLFLIFGGVFYIVSGSDPQKQETAKKTITYVIFGLMLVLLSYAVLVVLDKIGAKP